MANYPNTEQHLPLRNEESSPDQRLPEGGGPNQKIWSGNTGTGSCNGERGPDDVGDMIAIRLASLIKDGIKQVTSSTVLLDPTISEIKGSSDETSKRLQQSRKQADVPLKDELEAQRQVVHQAAGKVVNVLNDTMEELYKS